MKDTTTTPLAREQLPLSTYTVHVYREMRLRFDGIEADSPEHAAETAREMHFEDATDWSDCEGESLAALVDVPGDEEYEQSRVIDFEPGRMLKAAPRLIAAAEAFFEWWEVTPCRPAGEEPEGIKLLRAAIAEAKGLAV